MTEISYRWMQPEEVSRMSEIDRREQVTIGYEMEAGKLKAIDVDWDVPNWFAEGEGEHSVASKIAFCQDHLRRGGRMIGAFAEDRLVAMGLVTPDIRPGMAQLAYLHVSDGYRRMGIAGRLTREMVELARQGGAKEMYVTATPSASAVGFYRSQGFEPVAEPLPELFELEPEDIHMLKRFGGLTDSRGLNQ